MSISDKVISAVKLARQVNEIDSLRFEFNQQGSNQYMALGGKNLFLFENSSDCAVWVNSLNSAISPTLSALRNFYDGKVRDIIA